MPTATPLAPLVRVRVRVLVLVQAQQAQQGQGLTWVQASHLATAPLEASTTLLMFGNGAGPTCAHSLQPC